MDKLLDQLRNYQAPVVGIGVTSFTRTGPIGLLPNYTIMALLETADIDIIRQKCRVIGLEKDLSIQPDQIGRQNTASILKQIKVQEFLTSLGQDLSLLVYKSSPQVEKICLSLGIKILAPQSSIRDPFEDKAQFRILGQQAGLKLIPGETLLIDDLTEAKFSQLRQAYGGKLVFQLTDYKIGGGIGTLFINSFNDYFEAIEFIKRRRAEGKELQTVNVTQFIQGTAASISACVTKQGTLCGLLQTQLIDVPEAKAFKGRSGVWCGHDWGWKQFRSELQLQAEQIATKLGQLMFKRGYKGMFGLDLIVDQVKKTIFPVECNARFTGAFPPYSMLQAKQNLIPFDAFHLVEFLGLDYQLDLTKIQAQYRQPMIGAHLIMRNQTRKWVKINGDLKAGIYKLINNQLVYQRPGFSLADLRQPDELALVDRVPKPGWILKPGERLTRVLFNQPIATSASSLNSWAKQVCRQITASYQLEVIKSRTN